MMSDPGRCPRVPLQDGALTERGEALLRMHEALLFVWYMLVEGRGRIRWGNDAAGCRMLTRRCWRPLDCSVRPRVGDVWGRPVVPPPSSEAC